MTKTIMPALLLFIVVVQITSAQSSFIPKNLGAGINSPYDEISPVISPDRETLFFTRVNHPENSQGNKNSKDIWYAQWQPGGSWSAAQRLTSLNISRHNTVLSITADGNQLLLHNDQGLSISKRSGGTWSTPKKLAIKAPNDAALSPDGKFLIFAKAGKLYVSEKSGEDLWGKPEQVKGLNAKKILMPYLTNDNKTLYFASKTKEKQLELYRVDRTGKGWDAWSAPATLNDTINSAASEGYLHTNPTGAWGYFSSTNKTSGKGDIFMVKLYEDNPFVLVTGKVVNAATKRPLRHKPITILVEGNPAESFTVNRDSATYTLKLPFGKRYSIAAGVDHYKSFDYTVDASSAREFTIVNLDLEEGPLPYALLKGKLLVKNTDQSIPASARPMIIIDGEEIDSAYVDSGKGEYSVKLNHGALYYVQVRAKRFESFPEVVDLSTVDGYEEIILNLQADAEKMALVTGKIIDKKTGKPMARTIRLQVNVEGVSSVAAGIDSLSAAYELRLPLREKHTISASTPGYYPVYEIIDLANESKEVKISRDLCVVPFERGQSVRLNNIFFEPGKTVLNEASFPELDRFTSFLNANPKVKIEIGGHTDKSSKISTLSMAKAVVNYITAKGIAKNRITARGYAATKPVASNSTPEGKAQNRRIEFTIVEK